MINKSYPLNSIHVSVMVTIISFIRYEYVRIYFFPEDFLKILFAITIRVIADTYFV